MTERELLELMEEAETKFVREGYHIYKAQISDLAAFIDKYFLPRPLFEDGTPVKVGDWFALRGGVRDEVSVFYVYDDGSFAINNFRYDQDQRVKRPEQPEALDADGAPIKAGDKIYFVGGDGTPLKCIDLEYDGDVIFTDWKETGTIAYEKPTAFTHKKPDSWEQLEEDLKLGSRHYCDRRKIIREGRDSLFLQKQDIIRRAKALAGVDDE